MELKYWNYRILKLKNPNNEPYYQVCEVYYDENDKPRGWADDNALRFEELGDLKENFEFVQDAFTKPVLEVIEDEKLREIR